MQALVFSSCWIYPSGSRCPDNFKKLKKYTLNNHGEEKKLSRENNYSCLELVLNAETAEETAGERDGVPHAEDCVDPARRQEQCVARLNLYPDNCF